MSPPFLTETILRFAGVVEEEVLDPIELVERVLAAAWDFSTKSQRLRRLQQRGVGEKRAVSQMAAQCLSRFIQKTEFKTKEHDQDLQAYRVQQHIQWIFHLWEIIVELKESKESSLTFDPRESKSTSP